MTITAPRIRARKGKEKLVALTCYTTPMARLLDEQVDILLVGDSVGMVLYGLESTLGVTLPMMVAPNSSNPLAYTNSGNLFDEETKNLLFF